MIKKITNNAVAAIAVLSLINPLTAQDNMRLGTASVVDRSGITNLPSFIKLAPSHELKQEAFIDWAVYAFNLPAGATFKPYKVEKDELGYTHVRHQQYVNNYPVEGTQVITHSRNGHITMVNGDYYQNFSSNLSAALTEKDALQKALDKVAAKSYMWENAALSAFRGHDYTPKGELVVVHKKGADYSANNMRLAYKFNIYAEVPLYRANVFVDAATGEILDEQNLICTADVVGSAVTKYSGTVTMTCNNAGSNYTLQETGRGNGIVTKNLSNGTNYGSATSFTNATSSWTSTGNNQAATDAHWGAEMTYDYYMQVHNRNSIDDNGYALNSFVHYSTNFVNAFWDGTEMTYGDGNTSQGFTIMTALDVCGHEITHGLVSATANLGSGEAGALNEGFADIFGTTIEAFARPSQHDWIMGKDIMPSGTGIRNMSNPNQLQQPDTYQGTYWDASGEVHTNDGPAIYWYYLLCQGGTGTNDNGNAYNVTGLTMAKARLIAFRGLTVYFTSTTNYANARNYTIQAATDIYGACSTELQSTANAWYAVGVGAQYTSTGAVAGYSVGSIPTCGLPVAVTFNNTSTNSSSYAWDFGDGGTSTATTPTHSYAAAGTYTVTLVATGCGGASTNTYTSTVNITAGGGTALPLVEGFESSTSIPTGWTLNNPNSDAAWQISTTVAKTGTHSMGFNNCDGDGSTDMTGRIDKIYTKTYNFSSIASASMSFDLAYAVLTYSGTTYNDKLAISVSTDCGTTWTQVYNKTGSALATAPTYTSIASCWVPTSAQWRNEVIDLSAYAGQQSVMLSFENTSAWGTWIYIDNINITGTTGITNNEQGGFMIYPNPAHDNLTIKSAKNINSINVMDVLGKTVIQADPRNERSAEVDISTLPEGVYFVKVIAGDSQKLIKVVKQ